MAFLGENVSLMVRTRKQLCLLHSNGYSVALLITVLEVDSGEGSGDREDSGNAVFILTESMAWGIMGNYVRKCSKQIGLLDVIPNASAKTTHHSKRPPFIHLHH